MLCRDAARWFVGAREPFVADALPVSGGKGELMAAGIPARYADAIARAALGAGIAVRTMQAAPWAWAASVDDGRRNVTRSLVVPGERALSVVQLRRGAVTGIRRLRESADIETRLGDVLAEGGNGETVERIMDGMATAAAFAGRARGPELLADSLRAAHGATIARRTRVLVLSAAAMLVVAAGVELWGVSRQLTAVRLERARLRGRVTRAMASRDSATMLEAQFGVVATLVRDAPQWTAVIVRLTRRLPDDAWLQSLSASGDSVSLVGEAEHAADVFEALRRDPMIAGLRADAPIRREITTDRAPVEHYGLTVSLTHAAFDAAPKEQP